MNPNLSSHVRGLLDSARSVAALPYAPLLMGGLLFIGNFCFLFGFYGSLDTIWACCDAGHYLEVADTIDGLGLTTKRIYIGYRSYLPYVLVGFVESIGSIFGRTHYAGYALGSVILYSITSLGVLLTRYRQPSFLIVFIALCANPFILGVMPTPLQESLVVIFAFPLIAITLLSSDRPILQLFWAGSALGLLWMLKSSYVLIAIILFSYFIFTLFNLKKRKKLWGALAFVVPALLFVVPQMISSLHHFQTLSLYPVNEVFNYQLDYGVIMWRYDTIFNGVSETIEGLRYNTPFQTTTFEQLSEAPFKNSGMILLLGFSHIFAAFNYQNLETYIVYPEGFILDAFAYQNIIVGLIMFYGSVHAISRWASMKIKPADLLIDGMIIVTVAPLAILAVETRFTIIPLALLILRAGQWVQAHDWTRDSFKTVWMGLFFAILFTTFNGVIASTALLAG